MMRRAQATVRRPLLLAVLPLLLATSCIRFHGPNDVRDLVARRTGLELKQETGVTVTRSGIWLARAFVRADGEEQIPLRGLRRVEVGVYEVRGARRRLAEPAAVDLPDLDGWQPIVRVREDDERVFVLVREERDAIRGMLVVVAEGDELVLVRLRGRLDRIVEAAMRSAFEHAGRPELYGRVRQARGEGPRAAAAVGLPAFVEPWPCLAGLDRPALVAAQRDASLSSQE